MRPLASALGAAARFLLEAWPRAWPALLLCALTTAAAVGAVLGRPLGGLGPALVALAVLAGLIATGGLWRIALRQPGLGPGGVQLGVVEVRLAGVWTLTAAFLAILGLIGFVAALCLAYAIASAGRTFDPANVMTWAPAVSARGRYVMDVAVAVALAGLAWVGARISLAGPASVVGGRVQLLSAWNRSRGRGGTIIAGNLVLAAITAAILFGLKGGLSSVGLAGFWPAAFGLILAGAWLPMRVGLMAYVFHSRETRKVDQ